MWYFSRFRIIAFLVFTLFLGGLGGCSQTWEESLGGPGKGLDMGGLRDVDLANDKSYTINGDFCEEREKNPDGTPGKLLAYRAIPKNWTLHKERGSKVWNELATPITRMVKFGLNYELNPDETNVNVSQGQSQRSGDAGDPRGGPN